MKLPELHAKVFDIPSAYTEAGFLRILSGCCAQHVDAPCRWRPIIHQRPQRFTEDIELGKGGLSTSTQG
jgi:hypothetical protein